MQYEINYCLGHSVSHDQETAVDRRFLALFYYANREHFAQRVKHGQKDFERAA